MQWLFRVLLLFLVVPHVYAQCSLGYTGPTGGECTACATGKYKSVTGSNICTSCVSAKYNNFTGSTSSAACRLCPSYSTSVAGSSACKCNTGYTGPGLDTACVACVPGKYKAISGSEICTDCAAGKYNIYEAKRYVDDCWDCDMYSQGLAPAGSSTAEGCICNAGFFYFADYEYCDRCEAGYYKDTVGNQVCTKCPNASYANAVDAATACIPCPANSVCMESVNLVYKCNQLSICACDAGYYGYAPDGVACTSCPANTGQRCTIGVCESTDNCLANHGYYSNNVSATACPPNAGSNCFQPTMESDTMCREQAECLCNAGYTGPAGGPCIDPNAPAAPCDAGYTGPDGGPCTACAAGKYKASTASTTCTDCRAQSTSPLASTSSSACLCNQGLYLVLNQCYGCPNHKYGDTIGNEACTTCPWNTYSEEVPDIYTPRTTCTSCPSGSSCEPNCWAIGWCICNVGHYGSSGGPCPACDAGTYKDGIGYDWCNYCAPGYYQDQMGATSCKECQLGYYQDEMGATSCKDCPPGTTSDTATNACFTQCGAGYTRSADACSACAAGTWKNTTGSGVCSACGARTYSTSIGANDESVCVPCPENSGASCVGCGDASACTCNPGHAFENASAAACVACPAGTSGPCDGPCCVVCPAGTSGPCDGPCANCSAGTYRDAISLGNTSSSCAACPANSGATCVGCKTQSECLCNAGYTDAQYTYGIDDVCTACIAGKYKSEDGNAVSHLLADACTYCASGTYSSAFAGSTTCLSCAPGTGQNCNAGNVDSATGYGCSNQSQCRCNDMHYGQDGGPCAACPAGSGILCFATGSFRCIDIINCTVETCSDGRYPGVGGACTACPPDATGWNCGIGLFGTPDCNGLNDCYDGCARGRFGMGYNVDGCEACPPDSGENCYGVPGETCASAAECTCNAGYSGPAGGPCA